MDTHWAGMDGKAADGEDLASALLQAINKRTATVGILGLGYVGLPLALAFDGQGFRTVGFDVDRRKIDALNSGKNYLDHLEDKVVLDLVQSGRCHLTVAEADLKKADAICICVPTPMTKQRDPDLSYVIQAMEIVARAARPGQLIVLESTTYPGTTDEICAGILAKTGLVLGKDIFLAYSPEREDPGNAKFSTTRIPKVVSGDDPKSSELCAALYRAVVDKVVPVSSTRTAEAAKLTENIFRAVNIALVNELKIVFDRMGIDVWEVIDAAKTKPFGFMPFYPGPGLGGHCIPIDPFYLSWKAREYGLSAQFIELAGLVNSAMPSFVIDKLVKGLSDRQKKSVNGAKVLLMGIAYKKNINDMRESPALILMEELEKLGAEVAYHDPHVPEIPPLHEHPSLAGRKSVPLTGAVVKAHDVVLVATDHDSVDYDLVISCAQLIVDARNRTRGLGRDDIVILA